MRVPRVFQALIPVVLLSVAGWILYREVRPLHFEDVKRSIHEVSAARLWTAAALTTFNYFVLTFYDVLALACMHKRLPYARVGLTAFISSAFSHNIGVSLLSGGSVRYRLYSRWGVSALEVAQLMAFCGLTFWIGSFTIAGLTFLWAPLSRSALVPLPFGFLRVLGMVLLAIVLGYLVLSVRIRKPFKIRNISVPFPSLRLALAQILVPSIEWLVVTAVLFLLLPRGVVSYPVLLSLFLLAQVTGMLSQVPGGLGVFESIVLAALTPAIPVHTVVGCLVLYRMIYYLGPFLLAILLFAGTEVAHRRHHLADRISGIA